MKFFNDHKNSRVCAYPTIACFNYGVNYCLWIHSVLPECHLENRGNDNRHPTNLLWGWSKKIQSWLERHAESQVKLSIWQPLRKTDVDDSWHYQVPHRHHCSELRHAVTGHTEASQAVSSFPCKLQRDFKFPEPSLLPSLFFLPKIDQHLICVHRKVTQYTCVCRCITE